MLILLMNADKRISKISRNSVFDYFRSTFIDSINVFDCHLSGVKLFLGFSATILCPTNEIVVLSIIHIIICPTKGRGTYCYWC